jgi:hypothetical protein
VRPQLAFNVGYNVARDTYEVPDAGLVGVDLERDGMDGLE